MALVDLVMPKMGESITEATILKWHKQPGDSVQQDETILEIATDKVDTEVPSTAAGTLEEILFLVNEIVPVGSVIARIRTTTEAKGPNSAANYPSSSNGVALETNYPAGNWVDQERVMKVEANSIAGASPSKQKSGGNRFYSPLVLNIASNEDISLAELESIPGTGNEGRVTKKDMLLYLDRHKNASSNGRVSNLQTKGLSPALSSQQPTSVTPPSHRANAAGGNVEIIEMDRMRKLIADHMVRSKHTSPHVTSFAEADVTNLVAWREKVKKEFEKREGTKITLTPLFIEAIIPCIKKFPYVNSSVEGDQIILKKDIHFGLATALPSGNLIVPVIKNADQLNLVGLTKQVNSLAESARSGRLKPEDTFGGTFTLTNVGIFGSLMGTPIINQPQVAILAVGIIKKRPVVIETVHGDTIGIRHMMYLSLSYDHRIVDGSVGASFLTEISRTLESFDPNRTF